jgi:hypothetical protein
LSLRHSSPLVPALPTATSLPPFSRDRARARRDVVGGGVKTGPPQEQRRVRVDPSTRGSGLPGLRVSADPSLSGSGRGPNPNPTLQRRAWSRRQTRDPRVLHILESSEGRAPARPLCWPLARPLSRPLEEPSGRAPARPLLRPLTRALHSRSQGLFQGPLKSPPVGLLRGLFRGHLRGLCTVACKAFLKGP